MIELVDEQSKIEAFAPVCSELIEQANCGGLVTLENIRVIRYTPGRKGSK